MSGNGIVELGHTGLWVDDLPRMVRFYTEVVGLQVTDQDDDVGIVFLSSRPHVEHHELVLQSGRTGPIGAKVVHQISWRVDGLPSLVEFHRRFVANDVRIQQVVTHGNALGIYFFDPEENRNEVYWPTGTDVAQPFRKSIDLDQAPELVLAEAARLLADGGPDYQPVT